MSYAIFPTGLPGNRNKIPINIDACYRVSIQVQIPVANPRKWCQPVTAPRPITATVAGAVAGGKRRLKRGWVGFLGRVRGQVFASRARKVRELFYSWLRKKRLIRGNFSVTRYWATRRIRTKGLAQTLFMA
ncbi:predicted protein [Histoplasma capsulatum H143]|uniref:Uncharacterized protein n=1 Tax=Ajellomyces capsulatus (strain H143) TaxID=544712 RepID=C6HJC7_AJECH|nr:predicted protein [Histoplasma capsulatum H143]